MFSGCIDRSVLSVSASAGAPRHEGAAAGGTCGFFYGCWTSTTVLLRPSRPRVMIQARSRSNFLSSGKPLDAGRSLGWLVIGPGLSL